MAIARMMLKSADCDYGRGDGIYGSGERGKTQQSIAALTKGKTLLVIAHRLSTIQTADQIVVLQAGEILAKGTQEELLVNCPLYQKMWKLHIGAKHWAVPRAERRMCPMFKTVKRIIDWCGEFKGKLYLGFIFSFFSCWFAAMPVMVAAYTIGMLLRCRARRRDV